MGEADQAQRKGDIIGALDALDARVKPAIETGLKLQAEADVRSDWGRSHRSALAVLLEDRRSQVEPYREAILSNDQQKLVGALEAQVRLDKRALAIVTDFQSVR